MKVAKEVDDETARVRIEYTWSAVGMDLFEAGYISGSREYAKGEDPFKWPKDLRQAAFKGLGVDFDDSAAFPTARAAMVPVGREITKRFLKNRNAILAFYGRHLFRKAGDDEKDEGILTEGRDRMKVITNAYDMDAKEDMWIRKYGNPHKRTLKGVEMTCPDGKKFSLEKYGKAQGEGTTWMVTRAKAMWDFLERMDLPKKKGKRKDRKLMVKSYLLQEAEAVSREATIRWAKGKRLRV